MNRGEALAFHAAHALVAGSGAVWAWMLFACEPADPYAVVNHPWQPAAQHAHVLVAPLLVFAVGWLAASHAAVRLASGARARRRSGIALCALFAPMAASGYALQVSSTDSARQLWSALHLALSAAWLAALAGHLLARAPKTRAAAPRARAAAGGAQRSASPSLTRG